MSVRRSSISSSSSSSNSRSKGRRRLFSQAVRGMKGWSISIFRLRLRREAIAISTVMRQMRPKCWPLSWRAKRRQISWRASTTRRKISRSSRSWRLSAVGSSWSRSRGLGLLGMSEWGKALRGRIRSSSNWSPKWSQAVLARNKMWKPFPPTWIKVWRVRASQQLSWCAKTPRKAV